MTRRVCGKGDMGAPHEAFSVVVKRLKFEILVSRARTGGLWQGTDVMDLPSEGISASLTWGLTVGGELLCGELLGAVRLPHGWQKPWAHSGRRMERKSLYLKSVLGLESTS